MQTIESSEMVLKLFSAVIQTFFLGKKINRLFYIQANEENCENEDISDESEDQPTVVAPVVTVNVEEIESTAEEISEAITMEAIQEANQYNQENSHQNVNNNDIEVNNQNHCNEDSDYEDIK